MGDRWEASRHEDILSKGVPDVSYSLSQLSSGWIELKTAFTVRNGRIKFKEFTQDQRIWLFKRNLKCGHCFVLAANESRWYFIPAQWVLMKEIDVRHTHQKNADQVFPLWIIEILGGNNEIQS